MRPLPRGQRRPNRSTKPSEVHACRWLDSQRLLRQARRCLPKVLASPDVLVTATVERYGPIPYVEELTYSHDDVKHEPEPGGGLWDALEADVWEWLRKKEPQR